MEAALGINYMHHLDGEYGTIFLDSFVIQSLSRWRMKFILKTTNFIEIQKLRKFTSPMPHPGYPSACEPLMHYKEDR